MGIPPRDTPPVPSEDDDEEESNSEDEAGISPPLFSLAPSTREREPSVPDPDPELASQGISCQKLGSPAWNRFLLFANPQPTKPVLLLLDGHASHPKNLELIKMARDNNVVLLCFPTHCTHRMQPLDVSLMGPLSTYYEQEA
ncbi:hypothetical protein M8J75_000510 [Diaphorina citri]|nr:hypothetical protein M8J75_000510 [Diaphorina citri]